MLTCCPLSVNRNKVNTKAKVGRKELTRLPHVANGKRKMSSLTGTSFDVRNFYEAYPPISLTMLKTDLSINLDEFY